MGTRSPAGRLTADTAARIWKSAQVAGIVLTAALLVGLLRAPDVTLRILWNAVIPVLPAVFLVQPTLWRNVCPLATLNVATGRRFGTRTLSPEAARRLGAIGIALFLLMVPARRFLFNVDGAVLALTVLLVAVLALLMGLAFDMKAGFCNSLCPVLPVERLYGQRALFRVKNPRCTPCSLCTRSGCLELAQKKSVAQTLGDAARPGHWLFTPYGAFAAAFPGFIVGYYTTTDVALATAPAALAVYGHVGLWMLASWVAVAALALAFRVTGPAATMPIAGLSFGLYYWFAAPVVADALALASWTPAAIRTAALGLLGFWLLRAYEKDRLTGRGQVI